MVVEFGRSVVVCLVYWAGGWELVAQWLVCLVVGLLFVVYVFLHVQFVGRWFHGIFQQICFGILECGVVVPFRGEQMCILGILLYIRVSEGHVSVLRVRGRFVRRLRLVVLVWWLVVCIHVCVYGGCWRQVLAPMVCL